MAVTDLTGYVWVGDNRINLLPSASGFLINFISNNTNYSRIIFWNDQPPADYGIRYSTSDSGLFVYTGSWTNDAYKTIQITGGTDATNASNKFSTLLTWLQDNGTLTAPAQANTYNITHTLTDLTKGNITLQITPDSGYTYPTSLTISNGTIVSYDNTTGIAVISGDDTTVVSGECVEQASGYEVELYGYNGLNDTVYVQINDDPTWYYARMFPGGYGFTQWDIPNAYYKTHDVSIGIPNVVKIKFGVDDPTDPPYQLTSLSTGDFTSALVFNSTGSSYPAYATTEITMTQDSTIAFEGSD